jgi:hypothetical protein
VRLRLFGQVTIDRPFYYYTLGYSIVQLVKGRIPHLKYVDGGGDGVPFSPATIDVVYDSKPPIFAKLGEEEALSVISGLRSRFQLLDFLYGYFKEKNDSILKT